MIELPVHPLLTGIPRERVLCFTGHRPEALPEPAKLPYMLNMLHELINEAVAKGYTHFYTGLADGLDYYAAEYLFQLRQSNPSIMVIGVQPCVKYREFFEQRGYSLARLEYMLSNADGIVTLPPPAANADAFRNRNAYMVDRSGAIIAVYKKAGRGSGSSSTYRYATQKGIARCRICLEKEISYGKWDVERVGF
ncbi:MAG: DUF1273 domain-containing protein [Ruminococcus sp.]|nr:DUF1273 domain-containing protein [Ruminococcus sp.]